MKKKILIVVTVLLCFCLQSTLFKSFNFGGIGPNLGIVVTAVFGFMNGKKTGTLVGFFSGLLMDIFFGSVIGFYALIYMYIGFINGMFRKIFYPEDIKLPLILITVSDILYGILTYILMFLLRGRFNLPFYFLHIILPEAVYTIAVTIIIYPVILTVDRRFMGEEKRSTKKLV